jgi:hypothetical protein
VVGQAIIPFGLVLQSSIPLIVPKSEPINTSLQPTKFKKEGSFKDTITFDNDNDNDNEVPLEESNITFLMVVEEGAHWRALKRR